MYGIVSPRDWQLEPATRQMSSVIEAWTGITYDELERRWRGATDWLLRQFNEETGAFHGFYRAIERTFEPPQTVNLIAPMQLLAAHDRYGDVHLLETARRSAEWFYYHFVVSHPMSVVQGGVRDTSAPELWIKYTAEFCMLNQALYTRTGDGVYLYRARQAAGFLVQSQRHGFSPKFNTKDEEWEQKGWMAFGRVVEAFLGLYELTNDAVWRERAIAWGEHALTLQAKDGCFYLIDMEYYNTDLAADPLRALVFLFEETGDARYLQAARHFGDWHLAHQRPDGAWPLTYDSDGNVVCEIVGPGDIPNIGIALLRLYRATKETRYIRAAINTMRYSISVQVDPGTHSPYADDPNVAWGFWSWQPHYDYTLSGDQSTLHVRGMMFLTDYLSSLGKPPADAVAIEP
ncbi:MAG: AGE family epimerase/isomerase [Bacillota bacterium]|nr:AGE family epimerase/isomerase [Bacillota bacterium]